MALRHTCLRIRPRLRPFHTSHNVSAATNKGPPPISKPTSPASTATPWPPRTRPPDNDPLYKHHPSSLVSGKPVKGVQLLKDKPDIIAMPDDYYPDWLWQLLEPPEFSFAHDRMAEKKVIEEKKAHYERQLKVLRTARQMEINNQNRLSKPGQTRTLEERIQVRRDAQNEAWHAKREKEYDHPVAQFDLPREYNRKYHKQLRKEKIKQDNYERARGMKK